MNIIITESGPSNSTIKRNTKNDDTGKPSTMVGKSNDGSLIGKSKFDTIDIESSGDAISSTFVSYYDVYCFFI